jgi:hypothetical protein
MLRKPLIGLSISASVSHTAGRIAPEIMPFTLRDAERCD